MAENEVPGDAGYDIRDFDKDKQREKIVKLIYMDGDAGEPPMWEYMKAAQEHYGKIADQIQALYEGWVSPEEHRRALVDLVDSSVGGMADAYKVELDKAVKAERERILEPLKDIMVDELTSMGGKLILITDLIVALSKEKDTTLRVLVDGEWKEPSKEFIDTVNSIDESLKEE